MSLLLAFLSAANSQCPRNGYKPIDKDFATSVFFDKMLLDSTASCIYFAGYGGTDPNTYPIIQKTLMDNTNIWALNLSETHLYNYIIEYALSPLDENYLVTIFNST